MDRRHFSRITLFSWPFIKNLGSFNPVIKPLKLEKGDQVGLVSPGSFVSDEKLNKAIVNLESLGLKVSTSKNIRAQKGFTAGTIRQRIDDLHEMFSNPEIKAVWCARGGYGCGELLPHLNYGLIARNPKILIGYSDITALLHAVTLKTGLITFHGPVASGEFTPYTKNEVEHLLFFPKQKREISLKSKDSKSFTVNPGKSEGILVGGNLTLLAAAAGTPYLPDLKGKIIIIEEIGEKPYRIHRMLNQLKQATNLHESSAILLGQFWDCEPAKGELSLSLEETLRDIFHDFKQPIGYGFQWGHIDDIATVPIGIKAFADTENFTLTLQDNAVL